MFILNFCLFVCVWIWIQWRIQKIHLGGAPVLYYPRSPMSFNGTLGRFVLCVCVAEIGSLNMDSVTDPENPFRGSPNIMLPMDTNVI